MANRTGNGPVGNPNRRGRVFGRRTDTAAAGGTAKSGQRTERGPARPKGPIILACAAVVSVGFFVAVAVMVWIVAGDSANQGQPAIQAELTAPVQTDAASAKPAGSLPLCTSPAVKSAVMQRLKASLEEKKWKNGAFTAQPANFREISSTAERRECAMEFRTPAGGMPVMAVVTSKDRKNGQIEAAFDLDPVKMFTGPDGVNIPGVPAPKRR